MRGESFAVLDPAPGAGCTVGVVDAHLLPIGLFSRSTLLSVKALRLYHQSGLLVPAVVDPRTGYRGYAPDQLARAGLIRRLRDLDLPLEEVRRVVDAADSGQAAAVLARHRARLRERLAATAQTIEALLHDPATVVPPVVTERAQAAEPVLVRSGRCDQAGLPALLGAAYAELYAAAGKTGAEPTGPAGARYPGDDWNPDDVRVEAFVPVPAPAASAVLPARRLLAAVHAGPYATIGTTYTALGAVVAERGLPLTGPLEERYLVPPSPDTDPAALRTEVAWPVA